ncbi:MAG: DUF1549 domain-containing protein [Planctomycetota bacterium]|nr:DUF1549 domain-containing protein [Planctomycetota bacterium]
MFAQVSRLRFWIAGVIPFAALVSMWGVGSLAWSEESDGGSQSESKSAAAGTDTPQSTKPDALKKKPAKKGQATKKKGAKKAVATKADSSTANPKKTAATTEMAAKAPNAKSSTAKKPTVGKARLGSGSQSDSAEMMAAEGMEAGAGGEGKAEKHQLTPYPKPATPPDHIPLAKRVDELLDAELKGAGVEVAPRASDEDFLRRVSFDLAGVSPSPEEISLFGLDPDPQKRSQVVERLLASEAYAQNWSRYWRDVIYSRAVEARARIGQQKFEEWMAGELRDNVSWADVATKLLTATGNVREQGETALIFSQRAEPDEIAAETARIFLGIQLQCANCHDHPTDKWKRDEFHALAAFFPRIQVRPVQGEVRSFEVVSFNAARGGMNNPGDLQKLLQEPEQLIQRLDRNKDGKLNKEEIRRGPTRILARLFDLGDSDKDGVLTADEIKKIPPPPDRTGRGSAEYFMPDLQNPQSSGTKFDPAFFLNGKKLDEGMKDLDRRVALASLITSPENRWFARAFVNRMWAQLLGEGFSMPVDDMGPERTPRSPEVLDALSQGFVASGYDVKWLLRTIAATQAYQRQIRPKSVKENPPAFAAAMATRLRADQLYDAITRVLGLEDLGTVPGRPRRQGVPRYGDASPRGQFNQLFGFDPSTTPDEQQGNLPQALFLMNSPVIHLMIAGKGETRLSNILSKHSSNDDALRELYLLVHAREPLESELKICREYIRDVQNRQDAFEDILWSLMNSTEFQTRR